MKKIIACVLVLMMAASAMTAWAAPGDATLGQNADGTYSDYYGGCFAIGDTLYLTNSDSISTWRVGDAEAVSYALQYPVREGEEDVYWSCRIFAANESVYALALANRYGEISEFPRAVLCKVDLMTEDGWNIAKLTEQTVLNWDDFVNRNDQNSYAIEPDNCVGSGNLCYMRIYDSAWNLQLRSLNVDTGEMKTIEGVADLSSIAPYKDGALLMQQFNYDESDSVRISVYDPKTDSCQEIARIKDEIIGPLNGLAYDAATDTFYCVRGGEIHSVDIQEGKIGPAIADAPTDYVTDTACILSGGYYCNAPSGAFVRNLDPAQRTETRIRVYDGSYNNSVRAASVAISSAHGEISVAINLHVAVLADALHHIHVVPVTSQFSAILVYDAILAKKCIHRIDIFKRHAFCAVFQIRIECEAVLRQAGGRDGRHNRSPHCGGKGLAGFDHIVEEIVEHMPGVHGDLIELRHDPVNAEGLLPELAGLDHLADSHTRRRLGAHICEVARVHIAALSVRADDLVPFSIRRIQHDDFRAFPVVAEYGVTCARAGSKAEPVMLRADAIDYGFFTGGMSCEIDARRHGGSTGARRMQPSVSRCHFPASSRGCTSCSSYSPFRVSVTVADSGDREPLPLVEKSVQSAG